MGNPKYDGHCTHCFAHFFKDDPRVKKIRKKTMETMWVNAMMESPDLPELKWTWDKPLYVDFEGGCCATKRRIDMWTLIGDTIVAVEIDEHEHKAYPAGHDKARYNDLFMDFSGRYVFLRVNPHYYKEDGRRKDPPFEQRFAMVIAKLNELIANIGKRDLSSSALVEVHHMFYSSDTRGNQGQI